jgi:hypothetical protein
MVILALLVHHLIHMLVETPPNPMPVVAAVVLVVPVVRLHQTTMVVQAVLV